MEYRINFKHFSNICAGLVNELVIRKKNTKKQFNTSATKSKPLGIARALQLLLGESDNDNGNNNNKVTTGRKVPMECWGEYTYTTLMTCSKTPKEGRRIMKLMTYHDHPISNYSYTILLHCYTRLGDFSGAHNILTEMNRDDTVAHPSLAAYTSFLAAC